MSKKEKAGIRITVFRNKSQSMGPFLSQISHRASLDRLGISMSNAVGMFLRQVVLQRGIPFEVKLPQENPIAYGSLTKEQFDAKIEKGMADIREGRVYSASEVEEEMRRDFDI